MTVTKLLFALIGIAAFPSIASAQPAETVCSHEKRLYIDTQTRCNTVGAEIIVPSTSNPTQTEVIRLVQFGLNSLGYDAGVPDGIDGPQTHLAVEKFKADVGHVGSGHSEDFMKVFLLALRNSGHLGRIAPPAAVSTPQTESSQRHSLEPRVPMSAAGEALAHGGAKLVGIIVAAVLGGLRILASLWSIRRG